MGNDIRRKKHWTAEDVEKILSIIRMIDVESLDKPVKVQDGEYSLATIGDFIEDTSPGPQELLELDDLHNTLLREIKKLSPREQYILILRYGLIDRKPKTLDEVGKIFNVTRERVRQVELKALTKLRKRLCVNDLKNL